MSTIAKHLRMVALSAIVTMGLGMAVQANAQIFTVNPSADQLGGPNGTFTSSGLSGNSSTQIVLDTGSVPPNTYTATGWIDYTAFVNSSALNTGVSTEYQVFATFTQTFTCSSALAVGVSCGVDSAIFDLYAESLANSGSNGVTFTDASLTNAATVSNDPNVVLLGTQSAKPPYGFAGINPAGGADENVNIGFQLTSAGSAFFVAPNPFYSLTMNAFTNSTGSVDCNANCSVVAIGTADNAEGGTTTFGYYVPEPLSPALLGIGLVGLVLVSRKKAAKN